MYAFYICPVHGIARKCASFCGFIQTFKLYFIPEALLSAEISHVSTIFPGTPPCSKWGGSHFFFIFEPRTRKGLPVGLDVGHHSWKDLGRYRWQLDTRWRGMKERRASCKEGCMLVRFVAQQVTNLSVSPHRTGL